MLHGKTSVTLRSFCFVAAGLAVIAPLFMGTFSSPARDPQPPVRIPSYVAWTEEDISAASNGDAVRGLVISRRCEHCHGREGFSENPATPNLAGMDKLAIWKELNDFRAGKRTSTVMQGVATVLAPGDFADLAAYYSMLPTYPDPHDARAFPQRPDASAHTGAGARLILGGDGQRGIPPCQACHGPVGHKIGAPPLATQNGPYIQEQLDAFAKGARANDINMPMRSIANLMTEDERRAVAAYYGAGEAEYRPTIIVPHD